ncbi:MAG TPA: amino acid permease C-terminal domain-containing protein [Chthoniobacterales bacterium]
MRIAPRIILTKNHPRCPQGSRTESRAPLQRRPSSGSSLRLALLSALTLMSALPWLTWRRLLAWFALEMVIYFSYGVRHTRLAGKTTTAGDRDLWNRGQRSHRE